MKQIYSIQIFEDIKANVEKLISKRIEMKNQIWSLTDKIEEAKKQNNRAVYEALEKEKENLDYDFYVQGLLIDSLHNALEGPKDIIGRFYESL